MQNDGDDYIGGEASDGDAEDEGQEHSDQGEPGEPKFEKLVFENHNSNIQEASQVCLISKKWYALFEAFINQEPGENEPRPGKIDNSGLISHQCDYALSRQVHEGFHFTYVTKNAWDVLVEWYGGGPELCRDQETGGLLSSKVSLYPCIILLNILSNDGSLEEIVTRWSRDDDSLKDILKNALKGQGGEGKTPLARMYAPLRVVDDAFRSSSETTNRAQELYFPEDLDKERLVEIPGDSDIWENSIGEIQMQDGDKIIIEFQEDDKTWPSSQYSLDGRPQEFSMDLVQIGFQCEVMDKYNKWWHAAVYGQRINVDTKAEEVRVHFFQWEAKYDEWVRLSSSDRFKAIDEKNSATAMTWKGKKKKHEKRQAGGTGYSSGMYSGGSSYSSYYSHEEGFSTAKGIVGLRNLGNTCFMNSIIQCLNQSPGLTEYFVKRYYIPEINTENVLGKEGKVATQWAELVSDMWSGRYRVCVPSTFKRTIGEFSPQFLGYNQQDSQEFLNFLLDGIHEDLNRIMKKPYVEGVEGDGRPDKEVAALSWEGHLQRNKSIIVDLMQGQLKSKVVCPNCDRKSITFDPFMFLSVPVPTDNHKTQIVTWVPQNFQPGDTFHVYGVKIGREDNILQLKTLFKQQTEVNTSLSLMKCVDVYHGRTYEKSEDEGVSYLSENDDIFFYELYPFNHIGLNLHDDHKPQIVTFKISNIKAQSRYNIEYFGVPLYVQIDMSLPVDKAKLTEYLTNKAVALLSRYGQERLQKYHKNAELMDKEVPEGDDPPGEGAEDAVNEASGLDGEGDWEEALDVPENDPPFILKWSKKGASNYYGSSPLDWDEFDPDGVEFVYELYFVWDNETEDYNSEEFGNTIEGRTLDESYPANRGRSTSYLYRKESKPVKLETCMATFTETEVLGEDNLWYCNVCKEHRAASKTMEIWSSNDILIIHLKRFKYTKWNREKIDREVLFPIEGLDISPWIVDPERRKPEACTYDLFGVSNHSGGLGGGHYTAYVKNLEDSKWYDCNDSYCTEVDVSHVQGSEAYVLFYRRRTPQSSEPALEKARQKSQQASQEIEEAP